jgi:hypothetical protein
LERGDIGLKLEEKVGVTFSNIPNYFYPLVLH